MVETVCGSGVLCAWQRPFRGLAQWRRRRGPVSWWSANHLPRWLWWASQKHDSENPTRAARGLERMSQNARHRRILAQLGLVVGRQQQQGVVHFLLAHDTFTQSDTALANFFVHR
jgi:hypothetical protein